MGNSITYITVGDHSFNLSSLFIDSLTRAVYTLTSEVSPRTTISCYMANVKIKSVSKLTITFLVDNTIEWSAF